MKKIIAWVLCLVLLAVALPAGYAESALTEDEAYDLWARQYGDSHLWDWQVNAAFAREYPQFWSNPSAAPVLPPEDGGAISAEKAKKLAFRLIPEFGTEITSDVLFDLTCVVSSYRKPDFQGSFYSPKGTWDVEFWDTRGEMPVFVCALYLEAPTEDPQVLLLADGVRYESMYESPENALRIDPNGENSAEVRNRMKARDLVTDRFSADYGINQYYADLVNELGPFRYWTPAQKYEHCGVLMELLYWESQRLSAYHEGEPRPSGLLEAPVLEWRYGDPASATVPEEEARQKAMAFLDERYGMDCSACKVSAALYTGNCNWLDESADPFWVFGFYNETEDREAEVWVNAMTGEMPGHRMDDAEAVVWEEFARYIKEEGYEIGGRKVTEDMVDGVSLLYLEAEGLWYGIVAIGDSYWEIALDADTLELQDMQKSNG